MKLRAWADEMGVSYLTAWRWFNEGRMPVPAEKINGSIIVHVPKATEGKAEKKTIAYARVSSADQREDLDRQVGRLMAWAAGAGVSVDEAVVETGSALNGRRKKFLRVLGDESVGTIVVEHRDRLTRFGFEYIEAALGAQGRRIVVLEPDESADDLVRDMTEVLTSLCARLYGKRAAANRAKRALAAAEAGPNGH